MHPPLLFCLNIHIKTTIIKGKITLCYISQRVCKRESGCVSCYGFLYFCLTGSCLFLICLPISECDRFLAEFFNFDLNPAILTAPGSQIVLRVKNICPSSTGVGVTVGIGVGVGVGVAAGVGVTVGTLSSAAIASAFSVLCPRSFCVGATEYLPA